MEREKQHTDNFHKPAKFILRVVTRELNAPRLVGSLQILHPLKHNHANMPSLSSRWHITLQVTLQSAQLGISWGTAVSESCCTVVLSIAFQVQRNDGQFKYLRYILFLNKLCKPYKRI